MVIAARVGRLRSKSQFVAIAKARGPSALRATRPWLAASGLLLAPAPYAAASGEPVCLGLIVPKRYARRAIDRNLVKRVVREAMRKHLPAWSKAHTQATATGGPRQYALVVRLKAALPSVPDVPRTQLKKRLRDEADALFGHLLRVAQRTHTVHTS